MATTSRKPQPERKKYLSLAGLKARGWTAAAVTTFLGEPDEERPNPHYRSGPPMRLFAEERVVQVEGTPEFSAWKEKAVTRKAGAAKAVKTKTDKLLEWVQGLEIKVPRREAGKLAQAACAHYNDLQESRDRYENRVQPETAEELFLQRITVNYLRHQLTSYERNLEQMFGKVGIDTGYRILRGKVLDAIAASYPDLAEECERQKRKVP